MESAAVRPGLRSAKIALAVTVVWFLAGGIGHFVAADFFLKIVPPALPLRLEAVYISGLFELLGAFGLLHRRSRRAAGIGLMLLTVAVTPANIYMLMHAELFPRIPEVLLQLRLVLQLGLLACIWWGAVAQTRPRESA